MVVVQEAQFVGRQPWVVFDLIRGLGLLAAGLMKEKTSSSLHELWVVVEQGGQVPWVVSAQSYHGGLNTLMLQVEWHIGVLAF